MAFFFVEDILAKVGGVYKLVILASQRAVELNSGAKRLIDTDATHPSNIALEEILQGKIRIKKGRCSDAR